MNSTDAPPAASPRTLEVRSPYDQRTLERLPTSQAEELERMLERAHGRFRDRDRWLSVPDRVAILERAAEGMRAVEQELALTIAREGGKPLGDARVEAARAIEGVVLAAEGLRSQRGSEMPMSSPLAAGRIAFTRHEPIGVVVAVSAFNHPLNLIVHQVAPAVAAGCPVIVKPSELTPLSCLRFVQLLREAGLPEDLAQVVLTDELPLAESLVTDARVGFFSFIGSARVGWMLRSKLAPGVRCALEHGGAAPALVAADADLEACAELLTRGGFYHAGQVCVSTQRVFAERSIARQLAENLAERARALVVGDPTDGRTQVGPLIRGREVERVEAWVSEALDAGAEALCGGERHCPSCYAPTVLWDPPADSRVMREEIFGPVVCVTPYDELDEAIARANELPFAFQAAVFTRDLDRALRAATRLDASAVMVNEHTAFRVDGVPFAGLRQSGLGVGGIEHSLHEMQIEKMVVVRSGEL